jgi:hypothetical protein
MSEHIVEYIGKIGVIHTDLMYFPARLRVPRVGDFVSFHGFEDIYPLNSSSMGRIDSLDAWGVKDLVSFCCEVGSAFLGLNGKGIPYVSISGGPFASCPLDNFRQADSFHVGRFWNWGNNLQGGGQGVDFYIKRPLFHLKAWDDSVKERVSAMLAESIAADN